MVPVVCDGSTLRGAGHPPICTGVPVPSRGARLTVWHGSLGFSCRSTGGSSWRGTCTASGLLVGCGYRHPCVSGVVPVPACPLGVCTDPAICRRVPVPRRLGIVANPHIARGIPMPLLYGRRRRAAVADPHVPGHVPVAS